MSLINCKRYILIQRKRARIQEQSDNHCTGRWLEIFRIAHFRLTPTDWGFMNKFDNLRDVLDETEYTL